MNPARKPQLRTSTALPPHVNRRMVDTTRVRAPVRHLTLPCHEIAATDLHEGETLHALVRRTGWATRLKGKWSFRLPTICVLNGKPVLQRLWRKVALRAGDVVEFWSKPLGGGSGSGKSIIGLIAVIALAAFAPWAGGLLAGAMGLGSVAASVFSGLIMIGGSLLISALTAPKAGGQSDPTTASYNSDPLYSVAASGNTSRLLQPIPVQYGRVKSFPDFAITPWSEFIGNDQYLNVLLSVGLGKHSYEALYIDDTILWDSANGVSASFAGVSLAFYDPNQTVALFPTNVTQAAEVSGQPLTTSFIGGFVANAAGSTATALAVDLVFQQGCFTIGSSGNIGPSSVTVIAEARSVDDAGAPIGEWFSIGTQTYTYATRNPQRVTIKTAVAAGRYEARVRRTDAELSGNSGYNGVSWAGLRAFINGPSSFPASTVAIRIKANAQLTSTTAKKFGVLCTRILPVWNTGTQTFVDTATRSPAWAFYDATTNIDYGAGRPPSKVDFQGVYDLAVAAAARSDTFDFRFTSTMPAPEAFDTILKGTRARHRWSGDILTLVRDEWADTPRMLLTDREIARGSLSIDYALNTDDSADAVTVEYLDEDTWGPAEVQYPPNGQFFTATQPTRVRVDGVVNREQAYREAAFYYLCAQLRRVAITLDTEHDGRMLGFGSRVRVQTELPQSWGYTGAVVTRAGNTLTLSPAPTWAVSGQHYIAIRTKTGRQFGPVLCTKGASDALAVLDGTDLAAVEAAQGTTLTAALERANGAEDPSFDFGVGDSRARNCVVISGRPNGERVTLKLLVDNQDVHNTAPGGAPIAPALPALRDPSAPIIVGLLAVFRQGIAEPILDVSWFPAGGAIYYIAEVSYDSGATWTPIYEGGAAQCSALVDYAALRVRVQGVGTKHGAWSQIDVSAPTITVRDQAVALESLRNGIKQYITNLEDRIQEIESAVQGAAAQAAEQDAHNLLDKVAERGTLQTRTTEFRTGIDAVNASITTVEQIAADNEAAIAVLETTVTANYNEQSASITENATAIATVNGHLTASYGVTLDVNGYASGFYNYNTGIGGSVFGVHADYFYIAFPGQAGGEAKKVFTLGSIDGIAGLGFSGNMFIDGTVNANKLNVGTLSSITANIGRVIAGKLADTNDDSTSHMVIDLENGTITGYA